MATSSKGSTTPKDLKDDAGGQVAGGSPVRSGTAMPERKPAPSKPAASKAKPKPAAGAAGRAGGGDAPAEAGPVAKPRPKPASKGAGSGSEPASGAGTTGLGGAAGGGVGPAGSVRTAGGIGPLGAGAGSAGDGQRMSDEERQRRIAERAYRKAQERGFAGDRHLEDWLEAEREHNEGERR